MGSGRTRRSGPGGTAWLASLAAHAGLGTFLWFSGLTATPPLPPLKVYRVNIVSPPPAEHGPPEPVVVNAPPTPEPEPEPEPEPPPPEPEPKPAPKPEPKLEPKPKPKAESKPVVVEEPTQPKPEPKPAKKPKGANPDPKAETAGEGLNIQIDGEAFPFPDYLENITRQIGRYFRWTGRRDLSAEIYFVILPDGSVTDIRMIRGSGDIAFNFEARAAIEQAGKRRAFGPLPEGFEGDRLPISFYFQPAH
ncbi:MAG TPA: TonB C-terminal domain-containing protein [Longimicrobiales bacterium]